MLIVLDTETTGLPRDPWARVVELGAVALDDELQEIATFETLICQACPSAADYALRVNNITRDQIDAAPSPENVRDTWVEWLKPYQGRAKMSAFNIQFDRQMMRRDKLSPANDRWGECIMLAAMKPMENAGALVWMDWKQDWKWPRLEEAAKFFEVEVVGDAHRALTDARTAAEIWRKINANR